MSLNIGPQYYIDKNTSLVLVDSSFPTNSTAVVLLSSITIPGRIVSIKDGIGGLGPDKYITVSTTKGVYFTNSTFAASFNAPYGYMTCTNQSPTSWSITNTYGFPTQSTPVYTLSLSVPDIQSVSSINKVSFPVVNMNVSTLTFGPGSGLSQVYGSVSLLGGTAFVFTNYVNTNSLIFVQRSSLATSTEIGNLVVTKSSGSFTITSYKSDGSTAAFDQSIVDWILFNPAL